MITNEEFKDLIELLRGVTKKLDLLIEVLERRHQDFDQRIGSLEEWRKSVE